MKTLELGTDPRRTGPDDKHLAQTLLALEFPDPIGMAAGFDKNARVPRQLLDMGLGFAEVGTLTPQPQAGNPCPRLFCSHADRAIVNRLGFNNEGQVGAALHKVDPAGRTAHGFPLPVFVCQHDIGFHPGRG